MRALKHLLTIVVSAGMIAAIFWQIDITKFAAVFSEIKWPWFLAGFFCFLPVYMVLVSRLRYLAGRELGSGDALRLILAASSLNTVLPSKGGDLVKGMFIKRYTGRSVSEGLSIVVLERVSDLTALVVIMIAGLIQLGNYAAQGLFAWAVGLALLGGTIFYFFMHLYNFNEGGVIRHLGRIPKIGALYDASQTLVRRQVFEGGIARIFAYSLVSWLIQLFQFFCFFYALGFDGPAMTIVGLVPAAIVVGLLPITVAGLGTRDVAMIVLFAPWAPAEMMAGIALLSHLRYILPGLAGLVSVRQFLAETSGPEAATQSSE
jgi:uncharacterized membrane protein YbhN (UPF0104 family)